MSKHPVINSSTLLRLPGLLLLAVWLSSCAVVEQTLDEFKKPTARVNSVSLADMSLESVTLLFDLSVNNPNAIDLRSEGLDYNLAIARQPLLSIDKTRQRIDLPANGRGSLSVPVTLKYQDLFEVASALRNRNEIDYAMELGVHFDLPLIGQFRVPVSYSDSIPVPRLPTINFNRVRLDDMSLSRARVVLDLTVRNGNSFGIDMNQLKYRISANGTTLGRGKIESLEMPKNNKTRISLPLDIRFDELGATMYRLLSGSEPVNVSFNGGVEVLPEIQAWKPGELDINLTRRLSK